MKSFTALFLTALVGIAFAANDEKPQKLLTSSRTVDEVRAALSAAGGCNVNVCFALDGSGSVSARDFGRQRRFVMDVINSIAGNPIEAAAAQYGITATPISFLTDDVEDFLIAVDSADTLSSGGTSIGAGIVWCTRQLQNNPTEARKIVVLGDGRNGFGGSPRRRANLFRGLGGEVCAVAVGFTRGGLRRLTRIVGGESRLVLRVRDYLELADILEDLVMTVCGVTLL